MRTAAEIENILMAARRALAEEIIKNPDKSWRETLQSRFEAYLRSMGEPDDRIGKVDPDNHIPETTEAVLRSVGFCHG